MQELLFIINSLGTGGAERLVADLAYNIDKQKFAVTVLVFGEKADTYNEQFLENANIKVVYLNKKLGFSFKFYKKVNKVIKDINPDIISTHLTVVPYILLSTRKLKKKYHTVHNMAEKEAMGMHSFIMRIAYKFFNFTPVAISDTCKASFIKHYKYKKEIPCIYNGINTKKYTPATTKKQNQKTIFSATGRFMQQKNYKFMIDCFAEALKSNANIHLNIMGDGELRGEIENQIENLNIEKNVTLFGRVNNIDEILANSDVYLMSSLWEGLPLSVLEAMSCALPIITTKAGGVIDIVKDKENGLLIDINDKESYVKAILTLAENEKLRAEYGKKARDMAMSFDILNCTNNYEKLFLG